ncbi:helix-turn-helix domain-containing protein [Streptodolium elevatio]
MAENEPLDEAGGADLFRALGRQVQVLRERAGLSRRELGDQLGYSEETVFSVERGRRTPQPEFLEAVDRLVDGRGLLSVAVEDVERAKSRSRVRHPAWFLDYARLEKAAVELHFYATLTIPGLLQTESYARAIFTARQPLLGEGEIDERVAARLSRQEILTAWPLPTVSVVIEEAVLRRCIGGALVQQHQLASLLRIGAMRNVHLQVLPLTCEGHAGMEGPFILLTPKGRQPVAYVEVQDVSRLVTDQEQVRILAARYGSIRAQALDPVQSLALIEKVRREL